MSIMKEFFKAIARTFGRIVAYALIGTLIYFIASNFVHAAQYRILNRDSDTSTTSWSNISFNTDYTNNPIVLNTSGKTVFQLRDNVAMASGKKYDLKLQFDYTGYATSVNNNIDVIVSVATEIFNGSELVSIADKCVTNYSQFDETTYSNGIYTASHRILGTITCNGVEGTGYYPYFGFQIKRNNVLIAGKGSAKLRFLTWTYTLNTSDTNTQSIINNQNNNTQSIINNNNYNTQQITGSIDSASQNVADSIDSLASAMTSTESPTINLPQDPFNFTGVEGIFLLPITIARSYSTTCSPYSFQLFGKNITFPCINLENYLGSTLWRIIDALFIFGITIGLSNLIRRVYISFTSLSDDIYVEYYGRPETYGDMQDYIRRHGGGSD